MINYEELVEKYKKLGITDLPTKEMIKTEDSDSSTI